MRRRILSMGQIARETVGNWLRHRSPVESAALAFYTIFSLAPVLLVVITVAGAIWGEEAVRGEIVRQFAGMMGKDAAATVQQALASAFRDGSGPLATALGIITLLSGATAVFVQLQDTLNNIWEVQPKPGHLIRDFFWKRLVSFGMVLGIGFILLVSLVLSAALAALEAYVQARFTFPLYLLDAVNFVFSMAIITLLFALLFRYLPDARIAWRDVGLGAVFTAALFSVGKALIGLYLGRTGLASTYGAAGSIVIILVWVYYSALILLLGAEFTRVESRRHRPTTVKPEPGAMKVPDTTAAAPAPAAAKR